MKILDLFSGIGGFHKGFEQAGFEFDWVGFSEVDKYATAVYKHKFKDSEELGDITAIRPERDLPNNIDIVCGGFPCQAFSVSGLRKGFDDSRGTLFFEIARILGHYRDIGKPIPCFLLENVKGLLNHDSGRTFATIYRILSDLGYTIEFQLLNTKWFLPQNRERIYIVGYIGGGGKPKVFPITETDGYDGRAQETQRERGKGLRSQDYSTALRAKESRSGCDTLIDEGLKQIATIGKDSEATRVYDPNGISRTIKDGGGMGAKTGLYKISEATKKGYAEAEVGDSINLSVPNSKTRRGRVGKGEANTLDTAMQQYTIQSSRIRRLTPIECCRLQGFPDDWNAYGEIDGEVVEISDTQRYKQVGNAVTVNVVQAVAERIKREELI
tara:strand:+ start:14899 stop:16050 length:1152 start_codon:yes stop_codon:yes gene_type:complete